MENSSTGTEYTTIAGIIVVIGLVIVGAIYYFGKRPEAKSAGPFDLNDPAVPVILSSDKIKENMMGTFTLDYYLEINGITRDGGSPQIFATWGAYNKRMGVDQAHILMGYRASTEELYLRMKCAPLSPGSGTVNFDILVPATQIQRWNHIAIAVEGRSVDIFINGELRKSTIMPNVLTYSSYALQLLNDHGLLGRIAIIEVRPERFSQVATKRQYTNTSDTRGRPHLPVRIKLNLADIRLALCNNFGICPRVDDDALRYVEYEFA